MALRRVPRSGESARRHVGVREGAQGWTDAKMVVSSVMLDLSGGESVDDLRLLEKDEGLGRVLLAGESHNMGRAERRAQQMVSGGRVRLRLRSGLRRTNNTNLSLNLHPSEE